MAIYEFKPQGVCAKVMAVELDGETIKQVQVLGGCNGNLKGIMALVRDQNAHDVIEKLEGIDCNGRGTSCPDQMVKGIQAALAQELASK